jgi:hypothetical protein
LPGIRIREMSVAIIGAMVLLALTLLKVLSWASFLLDRCTFYYGGVALGFDLFP